MCYYIFGMQRSGTNYLRELILYNFKKEIIYDLENCWKHSIVIPEAWDSKKFTFIIYKNPYTWIESLCFRDRLDYVETQKMYPADELHGNDFLNINEFNIINLARAWKHFHVEWLNKKLLTLQNFIVIRYEDLLNDLTRNTILEKIAIVTNWKKTSDVWKNIPSGEVFLSSKFTNDSKTYYQNQKPTNLTEFQINALNDELTPELIESLGYEVLRYK